MITRIILEFKNPVKASMWVSDNINGIGSERDILVKVLSKRDEEDNYEYKLICS